MTTDDDALAERVRMLANYGSRVKYQHELQGYNCRLDEMQAALLAVKLPYLEADIAHRRQIADFYQRELAGLSAVGVAQGACRRRAGLASVVQSEHRDALQQALVTVQAWGTLISSTIQHRDRQPACAGLGQSKAACRLPKPSIAKC